MLTPLPLGLGLRYLWASQHQYFVSFISAVSLAGIGLGAAALIAILSVMNGFEGELRTRLLLLSDHATLAGVVLRGIDARDQGPDTALAKAMIAGEVGQLIPGSTRVALGRVLAYQLEAQPGDHVSLLLLRSNADGSLAPRIGSFEVSGEFEVGLADHDSTLAFASLQDVAAIAGPAATAGVRVFFADPFDAPARTPQLAAALGVRGATDWTA